MTDYNPENNLKRSIARLNVAKASTQIMLIRSNDVVNARNEEDLLKAIMKCVLKAQYTLSMGMGITKEEINAVTQDAFNEAAELYDSIISSRHQS